MSHQLVIQDRLPAREAGQLYQGFWRLTSSPWVQLFKSPPWLTSFSLTGGFPTYTSPPPLASNTIRGQHHWPFLNWRRKGPSPQFSTIINPINWHWKRPWKSTGTIRSAGHHWGNFSQCSLLHKLQGKRTPIRLFYLSPGLFFDTFQPSQHKWSWWVFRCFFL